jgi:putative ABC transport system permease protein
MWRRVMFEDLGASWFLASRAIKRGNKGTTAMIIVILAVVFVNMLFLPAFFAGAFDSFKRVNIAFNGEMTVNPRIDDRFIMDATDVSQKIGGIPGVIGVTKRLSQPVILSHDDRVLSFSMTGIDPLNEKTVSMLGNHLLRGEFLDETDTDSILLGVLLAGDENKNEEDETFYSLRGVDVGDSVILTYNNGFAKSYRVKGIIDAKQENVNYNAWINLRELSEMTGAVDEASSIHVKLAPSLSPDHFKVTLMTYGIQERIRTCEEDYARILEREGGTFAVLGSVSNIAGILIAVIIMFVVVYINTINKRKQIGIIKAIGINRKIILNSYILQVVIFATCGIIFGVILNQGLITIMTIYPLEIPEGVIFPILRLDTGLQAGLTLFVVSILAGYVPAWLTTQLEILDAMKG